MLDRLTIRDLAVIERAELPLAAGFNAVTGETGAGKSLVVQAVSLLVGERGDADAVRDGASAAVVEGEFHLAGESARRAGELLREWGLDFDGETVIVRREVTSAGRSRAAINQSPVTLSALKRLGEMLADLHGQHEHQSLLRPDAGLLTLDRLAGLEPERARFGEALAAWREATAELGRLEDSLSTFSERSDYLRHAAQELDAARLVPGEEEQLRSEAARLAHADRLHELAGEALQRLSEGNAPASDALGGAERALEQAAALDPSLEEMLPAVREARIAAQETARTLAAYLDGLEGDPRALEIIETRRDLIDRLVRKYRRDVPGLLEWRGQIERELAQGDDATGSLERARARVDAAAKTVASEGRTLSRKRKAAADEWGPRISRELAPLGFGHARVEFSVETSPSAEQRPAPHGWDEVSLRFTANPGESPRPLQRIASGGELSRVMLALKSVLQEQDRVDLLVFDEVDSGIGGAVAQAVGERLRRLSRHRQVICVTHLPMIAALAEHHLRVAKHVAGGRTIARVDPVEGDARVAELARMLAGGRVTDTTRRQARELLGHPSAPTSGR
jgi:DNA repair protein RecN (Recombination protein N)